MTALTFAGVARAGARDDDNFRLLVHPEISFPKRGVPRSSSSAPWRPNTCVWRIRKLSPGIDSLDSLVPVGDLP